MGFFARLFGGGEPNVRRLSHPRDLREGDIVKFAYLKQKELSDTEFQVSQVNTYIYGEMCYPELVLKDRSNHIVYLMVEEEDGEEYLCLSQKIKKFDMGEIMSEEHSDKILNGNVGVSLNIDTPIKGLNHWMTDSYRKTESNVKGAFLKGDARYMSDAEVRAREYFTSHIFEDVEENYALEIEVYDTGETELCVTVYHEMSEIAEMWPTEAPNTGTGA